LDRFYLGNTTEAANIRERAKTNNGKGALDLNSFQTALLKRKDYYCYYDDYFIVITIFVFVLGGLEITCNAPCEMKLRSRKRNFLWEKRKSESNGAFLGCVLC